ncbi:MAG: hypothetical protein AB7T31_17950 [Gemmatimonadales bacterium]
MTERVPRAPRLRGGSGTSVGVAAAMVVALPVLLGVAYTVLGALGLVGVGASQVAGLQSTPLERIVAERDVLLSTAWTLWIAAASTTLATVGASAVALLYRGNRGWDRLARATALLPLAVPHLAAAVGGLLILGQSGLLARFAYAGGWLASPAEMPALVLDRAGVGLIISLAWKELPFLALVAVSVLATRGAALEGTARGLGAGPLATLARVTWPLLWRGLLPAIVAVFAFVVGSYEAAILLGPSDPMALPVLTWERLNQAALARRGEAYALSLIATGIALAAVAVHEVLAARGRRGEGS